MTKTRPHHIALPAVSPILLILFFSCGAVLCQSGSSGDESYFPLAVGNWWLYMVRGQPQSAVRAIRWRVAQRELLHGSPVFHLWQQPAQDDEPLSLSRAEAGILEAGTERFLLKNPLRTGDRWSAKSRSLRAPNKTDAFEVISCGEPCSAGGHSFNDCAIIREVDEANNVASLTTYARGVGPVKYVYFKSLHSDEVGTTLTIKTWQTH
jgi:hypothetical protein